MASSAKTGDLRVVVSGLHLLSKAREPGAHLCGAFVAASIAHGNGSIRELAIAEHENVGHLLEGGIANSCSQGLLSTVQLDAQAILTNPLSDSAGLGAVAFGDGEDSGLNGSEPYGQGAAVVLEEDPKESLQGAEERPV